MNCPNCDSIVSEIRYIDGFGWRCEKCSCYQVPVPMNPSVGTVIKTGMQDDHYGQFKSSPQGKSTARKSDYVTGVWENIAPEPIKIESYAHLKHECNKRGVIPKIFMKPKSQGKGVEWVK